MAQPGFPLAACLSEPHSRHDRCVSENACPSNASACGHTSPDPYPAHSQGCRDRGPFPVFTTLHGALAGLHHTCSVGWLPRLSVGEPLWASLCITSSLQEPPSPVRAKLGACPSRRPLSFRTHVSVHRLRSLRWPLCSTSATSYSVRVVSLLLQITNSLAARPSPSDPHYSQQEVHSMWKVNIC